MLPEIQYYRFNPGSISVMFSLLFFSFCCYRGTSCHPQINSIPLDLNIDFLLPLQEANQLGHPLGICSVLFFLWASYVKDYLFYLTLTGYWPVVIWYSFIPVLRLFIWKDIPKDCHFMKESWLSLSIPHDLPTVDERCEMELDETDPAEWLKLEAAVDEYINNNSESFKNVCERLLLPFQQDEKWSENLKSQHFPRGKVSNTGSIVLYFLWFYIVFIYMIIFPLNAFFSPLSWNFRWD